MSMNQNQHSQTSNTGNNAPENKIDKYAKIFFKFHKKHFILNILTMQVYELKKPAMPVNFIILPCHWWRLYRPYPLKIFRRPH